MVIEASVLTCLLITGKETETICMVLGCSDGVLKKPAAASKENMIANGICGRNWFCFCTSEVDHMRALSPSAF